jgi:hypothetical protein
MQALGERAKADVTLRKDLMRTSRGDVAAFLLRLKQVLLPFVSPIASNLQHGWALSTPVLCPRSVLLA